MELGNIRSVDSNSVSSKIASFSDPSPPLAPKRCGEAITAAVCCSISAFHFHAAFSRPDSLVHKHIACTLQRNPSIFRRHVPSLLKRLSQMLMSFFYVVFCPFAPWQVTAVVCQLFHVVCPIFSWFLCLHMHSWSLNKLCNQNLSELLT